MKRILFILVPIFAVSAMITGCGQKEEPTPAATVVETPKTVEPARPSLPAEAAAPAPTPSVAEKPADTATPVTAPATGKYASLVNTFQGSDASTLTTVQKAVAALEGGKSSDAVPLLQQLLAGNLTGEQKQAVQTTMVDAQKEAATSAAQKSASDLKKSLPLGN